MAINQIKLDSAEKKGDKNAKRTNDLRKRINEVIGGNFNWEQSCQYNSFCTINLFCLSNNSEMNMFG